MCQITSLLPISLQELSLCTGRRRSVDNYTIMCSNGHCLLHGEGYILHSVMSCRVLLLVSDAGEEGV